MHISKKKILLSGVLAAVPLTTQAQADEYDLSTVAGRNAATVDAYEKQKQEIIDRNDEKKTVYNSSLMAANETNRQVDEYNAKEKAAVDAYNAEVDRRYQEEKTAIETANAKANSEHAEAVRQIIAENQLMDKQYQNTVASIEQSNREKIAKYESQVTAIQQMNEQSQARYESEVAQANARNAELESQYQAQLANATKINAEIDTNYANEVDRINTANAEALKQYTSEVDRINKENADALSSYNAEKQRIEAENARLKSEYNAAVADSQIPIEVTETYMEDEVRTRMVEKQETYTESVLKKSPYVSDKMYVAPGWNNYGSKYDRNRPASEITAIETTTLNVPSGANQPVSNSENLSKLNALVDRIPDDLIPLVNKIYLTNIPSSDDYLTNGFAWDGDNRGSDSIWFNEANLLQATISDTDRMRTLVHEIGHLLHFDLAYRIDGQVYKVEEDPILQPLLRKAYEQAPAYSDTSQEMFAEMFAHYMLDIYNIKPSPYTPELQEEIGIFFQDLLQGKLTFAGPKYMEEVQKTRTVMVPEQYTVQVQKTRTVQQAKPTPMAPTYLGLPQAPVEKALPERPKDLELPIKPEYVQVPSRPTLVSMPVQPTMVALPTYPTLATAPGAPTHKALPKSPTDKPLPVKGSYKVFTPRTKVDIPTAPTYWTIPQYPVLETEKPESESVPVRENLLEPIVQPLLETRPVKEFKALQEVPRSSTLNDISYAFDLKAVLRSISQK